MSGQLNRTRPGDGRRNAIRVNAITTKCVDCGVQHITENGVESKTGEFRCPDCFDDYCEFLFNNNPY